MSSALESINRLPDNTEVAGDVLIQSYDIATTSKGDPYVRGTYMSDGTHGFKVWDSGLVAQFKNNDLSGVPLVIKGTVDEYRGKKSLSISHLSISQDSDISIFWSSPYPDEWLNKMWEFIRTRLSEDGIKILDAILEVHGERFNMEFAAVNHHDNVLHGLQAHSTKATRIVILATTLFPALSAKSDKDLLILGTLLHDMGKIMEYDMGGMSDRGEVLTHRYFGIEMLAEFKPLILELKDQNWYDRFISILMQHHGEYGERPRSVEAYIVHIVDNLEACLTDVNTALIDGISPIRKDGLYLN